MIGQSVGPFRVVGKLGSGGMGDVYLAEDTRLGRKVALKSPSDSWLKDPEARLRLQREARAAARLNDPRIAAVYDVLDLEGRPYIVMEYVEGETLASIVRRGPMSVERALAVGIQLADALMVAHAGGVVHRDLKPGNIVLTSSDAIKVLDFGLAKTARVEDDSKSDLTHPGQLLGTPGYVAPEQLLGAEADARSDIYSAGAVLYQMLSGRPPFERTDSMSRALAALMERPRPLQQLNPAIPETVCAVVDRAMAREPAERYQSASALRRALEDAADALVESPTHLVGATASPPRRRIPQAFQVIAAVLLLLAVVGIPIARWWEARENPRGAHAATPVIAVLPFDNLSGDSTLEYVGAGMAETTSTMLAGVPGMSVVSRTEIREALGQSKEFSKVCKRLGVTYAVTGAVQQAGGSVQVTMNLLSADGGSIVAGAVFTDSIANLFALQRRIAEDVTRRLLGTLSADARSRLERTSTQDTEAMSAYWRGRDLVEKPGLEPIDQAVAAFQAALSRDPSFGPGYAGLGSAYWRRYLLTKEPRWSAQAVEAIERARQLSPEQPDVRIALATVYDGIGRHDDALAELQRVIELQPASDAAHRVLGDIYTGAGRVDEAVAHYDAAIRIRPDYWAGYRSLGLAYSRAGRYDQAIAAFRRITELQSDWPYGYQLLGNTHVRMGDFDAATRDYESAIQKGGSPATYSSLGTVYYLQRRFADAARSYENAIRLRPNNAVTHWNLGEAYRRLGRTADAEREYRTAVGMFEDELKVNPASASSLAGHATAMARLGRVREALAEAERAATLAPADSEVQYHLALTLVISGQPTRALDALERAVAGGYSLALLRHDTDLSALQGLPRFQALLAGKAAAPRRNQ